MGNIKVLLSWGLIILLLISCGNDSAPEIGYDAPEAAEMMAEQPYMSKAAIGREGEEAADAESSTIIPEQSGQQRMLIQRASLQGEIGEYDPWFSQLQELVRRQKGFIVNSVTRQTYEDARSGNITIRVPQDGFEAMLGALKISFSQIESEQISGDDVTEEFYDLSARLDNQRKAEQRLQEILRAAKNVKEILEVERELTRVRENIERMEGRKRYLQDQVSLSTIEVSWHEPYPIMSGTRGRGFWGTIARGFEQGLRGFADVLSGLIAFLIAGFPVYAFIIAAGWGLVRLYRRARGPKKAVKASATKDNK